jgi:HEAT repeat protein
MGKVLCLAVFLGGAAFAVAIFGRGAVGPACQGKRVSALIKDLASGDYQVRDQAAEAIQALGPEAAPELIRALYRRETPFTKPLAALCRALPFLKFEPGNIPSIQAKAAEQLGIIGAKDQNAIVALIGALCETDGALLTEIQRALRRCGLASLPLLTQALAHHDARVREGAAEVLRDFGPQARMAVTALTRALRDPSERVRCRAAQALGASGRDEAGALRGLERALDDEAAAVRAAAAEGLGRWGRGAGSALPLLTKKLSDCDTAVRVAAARSLWLIDDEVDQVVPVLIDALNDRSVGWQAPFVLGEIGPQASGAIPALVEALKRERVPHPLRTPPSAALALGLIGSAAVPDLITALLDDKASVRTGAAIALGFIGSPAKDAVPTLITLLKDKELEVREASALSLGAIGTETKEIIPALKELIRDEDIFVSNAAAAALRKIDPAAAAEAGLE